MSEIKVGEYVRTERGIICRIINEDGDLLNTDHDRVITYKSDHPEIAKHSFNILDLIDVGDMIEITYGTQLREKMGINDYGDLVKVKALYDRMKEKSLESSNYTALRISIVTKEQFKEMEYRL